MKITADFSGREQALVELFVTTFTASEGADEGALIGGLVRDLLSETPTDDIRVFFVEEEGSITAAAIFTRLIYPADPHIVFLLSPMAVAPDRQRRGIGQALLRHALQALRSQAVQIAMTYGDPSFYGQVGFVSVAEDQVPPPMLLSFPHGWIGQPLTDDRMPILKGPSTCVSALNRSDVW